MRIYFLCLWLLAPLAAVPALVTAPKPIAALAHPWRDFLVFETMAAETMALVSREQMTAAENRIGDIEAAWQTAELRIRPWDSRLWLLADAAVGRAAAELHGSERNPARARLALSNLLRILCDRRRM